MAIKYCVNCRYMVLTLWIIFIYRNLRGNEMFSSEEACGNKNGNIANGNVISNIRTARE